MGLTRRLWRVCYVVRTGSIRGIFLRREKVIAVLEKSEVVSSDQWTDVEHATYDVADQPILQYYSGT